MSNPYQPPQTSYEPPPGMGPRSGGEVPAILSFVCGLLGILFSVCCIFLGIPFSIAAIVVGVVALKTPMRGFAIAGIICGCIGLVVTAGMFLLFALSD